MRNTLQEQEHRPANSQLVRGADVRSAVRTLNERWSGEDGIALRLLECSMACTNTLGVDVKKVRGGALRTRISEKECIEVELARRNRPASVLRWDLPLAIFNGGRCVSRAAFERHGHLPESTTVDTDGFVTKGFVGHNVTASGIGWVLGELPRRKRGGAFGHDAWTFNFRQAGAAFRQVGAGSAASAPLKTCAEMSDPEALRRNSAAYAAARLASRQRSSAHVPGSLQQVAAGYKWGFVNTSWNCYHKPGDWEGAFAQQKAFAELVAERQGTLDGECSIWGSLYNQVHVSWNASDLRAIFYVNDTLTAGHAAVSPREVALLAQSAMAAARRAYDDALIAQRALYSKMGMLIPVVQFTPSAECFDARPLARRIRTTKAVGSWNINVFRIPEPALRELSTLLDLTNHAVKSKRRQRRVAAP
jgi:hypothetical protein